MRGITIAKVAAEAGVGVGTVSRVLNGSPSVSEDTRRRVLEAIATLDYQPSPVARALSTGRTYAVGVVAPFFTAPSVIERLRGVSRMLAGAGYQLILLDVERAEQGREFFRTVAVRGRIDGVLSISLTPTDAEIRRLKAEDVPIVLLDRAHPALPAITIDDTEGGRMAAEHLLALGHRRIAFLGDEEANLFGFDSSARRREGFEAAMSAAGVPSSRTGHCASRTAATRHARPRSGCSRRTRARPPSSPPPTCKRSGCSKRRRPRTCRCPRSSRSSASTTWKPRGTPGSPRSRSRWRRSAPSAPSCCCARSPASRYKAAGCHWPSWNAAQPPRPALQVAHEG